ncbi:MAG TPA: hypothetical protein VN462_09425 [Negativicutes bacterium]|nr:hypothetical protein [Negativicutes bacterium]
MAAFGYVYDLATVDDATIIGGADIPFSSSGPLFNVTHTAGSAIVTVLVAGTYEIDYSTNITLGVGAQIALAVNGTVDPSTPVSAVIATGTVSGTAMLTLAAGDTIALRNNSLIALTLALAPSIGAQMNLIRVGA